MAALTRRAPWALLALSLVASAAGLVLLDRAPPERLEAQGNSVALSAAFVLVSLTCGVVGAVIVGRLPGNPVGWLFLALGVGDGAYRLLSGLAYAEASAAAGWASGPLTHGPAFLFAGVLLLFPDGRPPAGWRPFGWVVVACAAISTLTVAFQPGPMDEAPWLRNPLGVDGPWLSHTGLDAVAQVSVFGAIASAVARFRRAHGVERQQLKWLALAALVLAGGLLVGVFGAQLFGYDEETEEAGGWLFAGLLCLVPLAAATAILRHRLYDVDLVIRRTLVYGALTAVLAVAYLGTVLLAGLTLGDSSLSVALATLAVAALFGPARRRVQTGVDRRFYRARYDAARTLEAFSARLRDEVELEAVSADLRATVRDTVQPAEVSVWLR